MLWKLFAADVERVEGIGAVGTVLEKIFVLTKKVQMKLCVTGDDADGCCPQRKNPCPTLVGRRQMLYLLRWIRMESTLICSFSESLACNLPKGSV